MKNQVARNITRGTTWLKRGNILWTTSECNCKSDPNKRYSGIHMFLFHGEPGEGYFIRAFLCWWVGRLCHWGFGCKRWYVGIFWKEQSMYPSLGGSLRSESVLSSSSVVLSSADQMGNYIVVRTNAVILKYSGWMFSKFICLRRFFVLLFQIWCSWVGNVVVCGSFTEYHRGDKLTARRCVERHVGKNFE